MWDALVDEVLVEGWLAVARIDPRVGGPYRLDWQAGASLAPTTGGHHRLRAGTRLAVDTDNIGALEFLLEPLDGETRGVRPSSPSCSASRRNRGCWRAREPTG
ncbi:MAG: hypothetical protein WDM88_05575 [Galbitalea sp.]